MGHLLALGVGLYAIGWVLVRWDRDPLRERMFGQSATTIAGGLCALAGAISFTLGAILFLIRL